jgi:hypothetical protein
LTARDCSSSSDAVRGLVGDERLELPTSSV